MSGDRGAQGSCGVSGAQRGFGDMLSAQGFMAHCWMAVMGPWETLLGCLLSFRGAQPSQGMTSRVAWAAHYVRRAPGTPCPVTMYLG